jgi:hypothetical protein
VPIDRVLGARDDLMRRGEAAQLDMVLLLPAERLVQLRLDRQHLVHMPLQHFHLITHGASLRCWCEETSNIETTRLDASARRPVRGWGVKIRLRRKANLTRT